MIIKFRNPPTMEDLQAWPATETEVTADNIRRFMLVMARAMEARMRAEHNPVQAMLHGSLLVAYGANALLLRDLEATNPTAAHALAVEVWRSAGDGERMSDLVCIELAEAGIDAEQIQAAYDRVADRMAA